MPNKGLMEERAGGVWSGLFNAPDIPSAPEYVNEPLTITPEYTEEEMLNEAYPQERLDVESEQMALRTTRMMEERKRKKAEVIATDQINQEQAKFDPYTTHPEMDVPPPAEGEVEDESNPFRSVVNFLFSDEMALLGMKWNEDGFNMAFDNVKEQVVEHPYMTALTLGMYLFPLTASYMKAGKIATRAAKLLGEGNKIKRGWFGVEFGTDHAPLVRKLVTGWEGEGKNFLSESTVEAIKNGSDDLVRSIVPMKDLKKWLTADAQLMGYYELKDKIASGVASNLEQKKFKMMQLFANRYHKGIVDPDPEHILQLDKFFTEQNFHRWLASAPGPEAGESLYKYMIGSHDYTKLVDEVGDEAALWGSSLKESWHDLYKKQVEEGFVDATSDIHKFFTEELGGFHVPALLKGTPGATKIAGKTAALVKSPGARAFTKEAIDVAEAMGGPTMLQRGKYLTREAIEEDLGLLITDPKDLTVAGYVKDAQIFQLYRTFRDLLVDGLEGKASANIWLKTAEEFDKLPLAARANYVSLEELSKTVPGLASRMTRMVNGELVKRGKQALVGQRIPAIETDFAEAFFGSGGASEAAKMSSSLLGLWTAVHKTSRTALNPPTHMSNLVGNMSFLAMAGMNPFSPTALNDAKLFTDAFIKMAKKHRAGMEYADILTKESLSEIFGGKTIKDKLGNKIDLAELFSDNRIKELIEEQAFEQVEGLGNLRRTVESIERFGEREMASRLSGDEKAARAALRSVTQKTAQVISGIGELPGAKQTLNFASSMYLAEDVVPKAMMVMNLARKGWGTEAILLEVGRRLPQYRTVGKLPQKARRLVLPWVTFPAEASRILKNNMMDRPIQTSMWLQAPVLTQALLSHAGLGPDLDEVAGAYAQAPPWAQRYNTALVEGQAGEAVPAMAAGAAWGGAVGTKLAGAKGAAVGVPLGAVAAGAASKLFGHDQTDDIRSWVLDFLPYSTITPASTSPYELDKIDPMTPGVGGVETFRTAIELSPVEPYAVVLPLIDLYRGRGDFGAEVSAPSFTGMASKAALGLMGQLAPPFIQKYGMKIMGPGQNPVPMAETYLANGSSMAHPKAVTGTLFGLSLAGLTALGLRGPGGAAGKIATVATVGLLGGLAGREINVQRLLSDTGNSVDPRTQEYGEWTHEFVLNSMLGVGKSWKVTPEQRMVNESFASSQYQNVRSGLVSQFRLALMNNDKMAYRQLVAKIKETFLHEHGNAGIAAEKFSDWLRSEMMNAGQLQGISRLSVEKLHALASAWQDEYEKTNSAIALQQLNAVMTEINMRDMKKIEPIKFVEGHEKHYRPKREKQSLYK